MAPPPFSKGGTGGHGGGRNFNNFKMSFQSGIFSKSENYNMKCKFLMSLVLIGKHFDAFLIIIFSKFEHTIDGFNINNFFTQMVFNESKLAQNSPYEPFNESFFKTFKHISIFNLFKISIYSIIHSGTFVLCVRRLAIANIPGILCLIITNLV